ncbi:MAG: hypothetical protein KY452_13400 [Actinobacteria bacterium]|nr:hypothetical protein [Actinomycetota bacterium]
MTASLAEEGFSRGELGVPGKSKEVPRLGHLLDGRTEIAWSVTHHPLTPIIHRPGRYAGMGGQELDWQVESGLGVVTASVRG